MGKPMPIEPLLIAIAMEIKTHINNLDERVKVVSKKAANKKKKIVEGVEGAHGRHQGC